MFYKLSSLYDDALSDQILWNYYNIPSPSECTALSNYSVCKSLIINTLYYGGKEDSFLYHCINDLSEERVFHIVSSYFLGIIFYKQSKSVRNNIDRFLVGYECKKTDLNDKGRKFSYEWMLICMFHDLGYVIEDGKYQERDWKKLIDNFPKKPKGIPQLYGKQLIAKYAKFRKHKYGVYDHGIYGGEVFYSELCRLRKAKSSYDNSLYWGEEMIDFYALASWIIICHNIWIKSESDTDAISYKCHGLDKLIRSTDHLHINSRKHPLLFLFCLIDSLDFCKFLGTDIGIWSEQIAMEFSDEKVIIDLSQCKSDFESKILELNNWLTRVKEIKIKFFEIFLH